MNTQTQSEDGIILCQPKLLQYLNQYYVLQYHEIKNQRVNFFFFFFFYIFYFIVPVAVAVIVKNFSGFLPIFQVSGSSVCVVITHIKCPEVSTSKEVIRLLSLVHFCPKQVTVWMNRYVTCKSIFMPLTFLSNLLPYTARARERFLVLLVIMS